ncbi:MAG: hypothetical protein EYC70_01240 [Planctomycetota bacterium]|nr:MAG: hypothetical protein EYC70_01240 [Planctomycetota bacterium]
MRLCTLLLCLFVLSLAVGVAPGLAAPAPSAPAIGSGPPLLDGPASFLVSSPASAWATLVAGGGNRNHLPDSAIPGTPFFVTCSVDTSDPPGAGGRPPSCSTPAAGARCSAMCDSGQVCSARFEGGGPAAECSTFGAGVCTALQPRPAGMAANSFCSATGGGFADVQCSVMQLGAGQCSAQNPAVAGNQCSVSQGSPPPQSTQCSVFAATPGARNFCSVAKPPGAIPKLCSTSGGFGSQCSVAQGAHGSACTAFAGAPAGTCSVLGGAGHCSVIDGAPGTFCRWP